jgi:hypothetical protein
MIRMHLRLSAAAALMACALGCGGREAGSPAGPVLPIPTAPTGNGPTASVRVVSTLTDQRVSGASVSGASVRSTPSDSDGLVILEASAPGRYAVRVTAAQFVTRQTTVAIPGSDARLDLIPSSFDLVAFDQMFRGATSGGRLIKWLAAPALVVQRTGLLWANSPNDRYFAEDEQWTDGEIDGVIADLTFGLQTISAGVFPAFSTIRVEQAAAGTMVTVPQAGAIVVARYRSLHGPSGDRVGGLGKTNTDAAGVIHGGMIMLDRDSEVTQPAFARRLRVHELGHALGTSHVTSRVSFMNTANGGLPNEADQEAFRVAARRPPGNRSPDVDRADFTLNAAVQPGNDLARICDVVGLRCYHVAFVCNVVCDQVEPRLVAPECGGWIHPRGANNGYPAANENRGHENGRHRQHHNRLGHRDPDRERPRRPQQRDRQHDASNPANSDDVRDPGEDDGRNAGGRRSYRTTDPDFFDTRAYRA